VDESRRSRRRAGAWATKGSGLALAQCVAVLALLQGCTIEEVSTVLAPDVTEGAPRFVVTETADSMVVSESGTTADFSVALDAQPTSVVVLTITSGDPGEVRVSPSELAFTPSSWSAPRMVTVTGVDDPLVDGLQVTSVTAAVDPDNSDAAFASTPDVSVSVSTTDDDVAGIRVTGHGDVGVTETGTSDAFAVALTGAPISNVVLTVTSGDPGEATVSPASLTFTSTSWDVLQTVTVTGADEDVIDGTQTTIVTVAVDPLASDDAFDGAAAAVVSVTTSDDDEAGFTLTESDGSTEVTRSGGTDSFTAVLTAQPASNVVLTVRPRGRDDVEATPTSLTFTEENWNVAQTVRVTGEGGRRDDDDDHDDDDDDRRAETRTIRVSVLDSSSDDPFDSSPDQTVTVRITNQ